jgi:hypothetical protein
LCPLTTYTREWAPVIYFAESETLARRRRHCRLVALRGNIPRVIHISDGKWHDINVLDNLIPEPGAFYVMDRRLPGAAAARPLPGSTTGKFLVFLTNHFGIPALTVCSLYRSRWQVELLFKWIKQHLRIKRFFGTSQNAVKSQVWIAVATFVLVAIARKRSKLDFSLHTLLQALSVTPFEKIPLFQLFSDIPEDAKMPNDPNQLILL